MADKNIRRIYHTTGIEDFIEGSQRMIRPHGAEYDLSDFQSILSQMLDIRRKVKARGGDLNVTRPRYSQLSDLLTQEFEVLPADLKRTIMRGDHADIVAKAIENTFTDRTSRLGPDPVANYEKTSSRIRTIRTRLEHARNISAEERTLMQGELSGLYKDVSGFSQNAKRLHSEYSAMQSLFAGLDEHFVEGLFSPDFVALIKRDEQLATVSDSGLKQAFYQRRKFMSMYGQGMLPHLDKSTGRLVPGTEVISRNSFAPGGEYRVVRVVSPGQVIFPAAESSFDAKPGYMKGVRGADNQVIGGVIDSLAPEAATEYNVVARPVSLVSNRHLSTIRVSTGVNLADARGRSSLLDDMAQMVGQPTGLGKNFEDLTHSEHLSASISGNPQMRILHERAAALISDERAESLRRVPGVMQTPLGAVKDFSMSILARSPGGKFAEEKIQRQMNAISHVERSVSSAISRHVLHASTKGSTASYATAQMTEAMQRQLRIALGVDDLPEFVTANSVVEQLFAGMLYDTPFSLLRERGLKYSNWTNHTLKNFIIKDTFRESNLSGQFAQDVRDLFFEVTGLSSNDVRGRMPNVIGKVRGAVMRKAGAISGVPKNAQEYKRLVRARTDQMYREGRHAQDMSIPLQEALERGGGSFESSAPKYGAVEDDFLRIKSMIDHPEMAATRKRLISFYKKAYGKDALKLSEDQHRQIIRSIAGQVGDQDFEDNFVKWVMQNVEQPVRNPAKSVANTVTKSLLEHTRAGSLTPELQAEKVKLVREMESTYKALYDRWKMVNQPTLGQVEQRASMLAVRLGLNKNDTTRFKAYLLGMSPTSRDLFDDFVEKNTDSLFGTKSGVFDLLNHIIYDSDISGEYNLRYDLPGAPGVRARYKYMEALGQPEAGLLPNRIKLGIQFHPEDQASAYKALLESRGIRDRIVERLKAEGFSGSELIARVEDEMSIEVARRMGADWAPEAILEWKPITYTSKAIDPAKITYEQLVNRARSLGISGVHVPDVNAAEGRSRLVYKTIDELSQAKKGHKGVYSDYVFGSILDTTMPDADVHGFELARRMRSSGRSLSQEDMFRMFGELGRWTHVTPGAESDMAVPLSLADLQNSTAERAALRPAAESIEGRVALDRAILERMQDHLQGVRSLRAAKQSADAALVSTGGKINPSLIPKVLGLFPDPAAQEAYSAIFADLDRALRDSGLSLEYLEGLSDLFQGSPISVTGKEARSNISRIIGHRLNDDATDIITSGTVVHAPSGRIFAPLSAELPLSLEGGPTSPKAWGTPLGELLSQLTVARRLEEAGDSLAGLAGAARYPDEVQNLAAALTEYVRRLNDPEVLAQIPEASPIRAKLVEGMSILGEVIPDTIGETAESFADEAAGFADEAAESVFDSSGTKAAEDAADSFNPTTMYDFARKAWSKKWIKYPLITLGTLGIARTLIRPKDKDHTQEKAQGSSYLPGNSTPYTGERYSIPINAMPYSNYRGAANPNGVTYIVNTRGNFDPNGLQSQVQYITGADSSSGVVYYTPNSTTMSDIDNLRRSY